MATIKNTSNVLGNLLNQVQSAAPVQQQSNPFSGTFGGNVGGSMSIDDDSIPSGMLDVAPVFELNYKSTQKQCIKKAKQQLQIIVNEVVPQLLQNSNMIIDKVEQDAEQLGNLYYEYIKSDKIVQACMDTIARGETQARLFEVYSKLSKQQQDLSKQITETQNQMRKYYIDTYLDLQQKDDADENLAVGLQKEAKAIENKSEEPEEVKNVIVGTDNAIKMLAEKKKKAMMAKFEEVKDE